MVDVAQIEKRTKFLLDGKAYEHADPQPELPEGSVRRFVYGSEPKVIAQVSLAGGGTVEVHGYAAHYNQEWVNVVWTDDASDHLTCWVLAAGIRRPTEGEWRGRFVQF